MSERNDKTDPGKPKPSSRVLKKAKSFRDDLKSRIVQRSPSLTQSSSSRSPRHRRRTLTRGASFSDSTTPDRTDLDNDVEKLEQQARKVFQSLKYLQDVVDKNIPDMLPGSATIVLETVMEVHQHLGNYFDYTDSCALLSMYNQTNTSLANLIRWADYVLLHGSHGVDKDSAHDVIRDVNEGVRDFLSMAIDKLTKRRMSSQALPKEATVTKRPGSVFSENNNVCIALPDIPLTPRELKILEDTNRMSGFDQYSHINNNNDSSSSSNGDLTALLAGNRSSTGRSLSDSCQLSSIQLPSLSSPPPPIPARYRRSSSTTSTLEGSCCSPVFLSSPSPSPTSPPPPKPPIPGQWTYPSSIIRRKDSSSPSSPSSSATLDLGEPPPLPAKRRTATSSISFFMPSPQLCPRSCHSPQREASPQDRASPTILIHPASSNADVVATPPRSQSPSSSISSVISVSEDDLLDNANTYNGRSKSPGCSSQDRTSFHSRTSCYDNLKEEEPTHDDVDGSDQLKSTTLHAETTFPHRSLSSSSSYTIIPEHDEMPTSMTNSSLLASQRSAAYAQQSQTVISKTSIVLRTSESSEAENLADSSELKLEKKAINGLSDLSILQNSHPNDSCDISDSSTPPPLPVKRNPSSRSFKVFSQYDNIAGAIDRVHHLTLNSVPPPVNTSMRMSHSAHGFVQMTSGTSTHVTTSQETISSSSGFISQTSTGTSSSESLQKPPPLPPKKKKVPTATLR